MGLFFLDAIITKYLSKIVQTYAKHRYETVYVFAFRQIF